MSEGMTTMVSMNELEKQIVIARNALVEAQEAEYKNQYDDAMLSMERTYAEGFLEALEFIYILQNGHEYNGA
jgi:phage anti-repressor protein